MTSRDVERMTSMLEEALALGPAERERFLRALGHDDAALADELASLLHACDAAPDGLDALASQVLPRVVAAFAESMEEREPPLPTRLGRYEIVERLSAGGMAEVFLAHDPELDRLVALKLLPIWMAEDAAARSRLRTEARAASALDHPNIGVVHEIGISDGPPDRLFIVMAYYAGDTLQQTIGRGPLPLDAALDYAIQMAEGVGAAHAAGIVHRDIKPANVIVTAQRQVRLLDFGLAKLDGADHTRPGTTVGTLAYMSPEQTRGDVVDHRTDIWSLGAVLHEMLTGRQPFRGESDRSLINAIRHDALVLPDRLRDEVPAELSAVVRRCLDKNRDHRYGRTDELIAALRSVQQARAGSSRRGRWSSVPRAIAASRGRRAFRPMVAVVALVALSTAALAFKHLRNGTVDATDDRSARATSPLVLVLPFAAVDRDTMLTRLGRDLVVTLSAGLDGVADLRTVDALTVLGQPLPESGVFSRADGSTLAQRLGASRVLHGALIRSGVDVRVEAALHDEAGDAPPIRVSVTGDPDRLIALSDSVALLFLRQLLSDAPVVAPSIRALTTSSMPALRAYLEGEHALAAGDMPRALGAFERAFAFDSTFWYAYLRSLVPRSYREASVPVDSAVMRRVVEHRAALPPADLLMVESWMATTRSERLARLRTLTERFAHHFPGWWEYANFLVHQGPYSGTTYEDARSALERAVMLNPTFAPGWDHLVGNAVALRDSAAAAHALARLEQVSGDAPDAAIRVRVARLRTEALRSGRLSATVLAETAEFISSAPWNLAEAVASGLVADGSMAAQIRLNRELRSRGSDPELAIALWRGEALAWAARGAWDSALVAVNDWSLRGGTADARVGAYRLAVAGALLGAVPVATARLHRPPAAGAAHEYHQTLQEEQAWLDGVLAWVERDGAGIDIAVRRLQLSPDSHADLLRRSLAALALQLAGETEAAARDMLALEREIADRWGVRDIGARHPILIAVDRLLCARWLVALGNEGEAGRILTWHEASPGPALFQAWDRVIATRALLDRARIAHATRQDERARVLYGRFIDQYDMPSPALEAAVDSARHAIADAANEVTSGSLRSAPSRFAVASRHHSPGSR